jgi:hypothetical protein
MMYLTTVSPGSIGLPPMGRSPELTSVAPPSEQLRELDAGTRHAWITYSERLRELNGEEYERAESESWDELQTELQRIGQEREALTARVG